MKSELKHLDEIEEHYNTEYALIKDIHYREGEILKLGHINAKHCREIERLNARISTILETTQDVSDESQDTASDDKIDRITELKNLFHYLKTLLIDLSHKEGNATINPDDIDVKYIEAASRYCFPILLDERARLGDGDLHKIELADSILHKFGIETMAKYEELIQRGDIGIDILDHRVPHPPKGL